MTQFDVFVKGRFFDTLVYDKKMTVAEVKKYVCNERLVVCEKDVRVIASRTNGHI
jgi:hypothetical protein